MKHHAECVDVASRINGLLLTTQLFRAHVLKRSQQLAIACRVAGRETLWDDSFCDSKVDDFWLWAVIDLLNENV